MRGKDLLDKMELIDAAYIDAAEKPAKTTVRRTWLKRAAAAAACLALILFCGILPTEKNNTENIGGIVRSYKHMPPAQFSEAAIMWQWEYLTPEEKYTAMQLRGKDFRSKGSSINAELLDESLGFFEVTGFDTYTERQYKYETEVFSIKGISEELLVAVALGENYFVFGLNEYEPPQRLGEILDNYSLLPNISFDRFDIFENKKKVGHQQLTDEAFIKEILSSCRDAEFLENAEWRSEEGKYLGFVITSEALGVYKRVIYITDQGYLKTNIFDYEYTFNIGKAKAQQIIDYAINNSTAATEEPFLWSIAGTLTEIGEDYIVIDDTVLCNDENDGMCFRVPLSDLRISRKIDTGKIKAGDTVIVAFKGEIKTEAGNIIENAVSLSKAYLSEHGISVPE